MAECDHRQKNLLPPGWPGGRLSQKTLNMIDAAYDILAEIQPATVRAVCYRLFGARLIENMPKGERDAASAAAASARLSSRLRIG